MSDDATTARPRLHLLSAGQIEAVHQASLHVLSESGIRVDSDEARQIFAKGGARVSGERVYPERDLIEWAVTSAPATIDIFDRGGKRALCLGSDETRFGTGVTNLWYQDPLSDAIVPFSREHLVRGVRLSQALANYDVISTLGVLRDLPPRVADLYAVLEMAANATKPLVLLISDESLFVPALDLLETIHGELGEAPFVMPYLNPITPLVANAGTTDKLLESVRRGMPVIYSNYGMAGMTTPLSCAGALAFLNAELLLGLLLGQLARPGAPMILGSLPMFFDMKTMVDFYDPQTHLINLACAEMMAHYEIPHAGTSGSGDGWGPDLLAAGAIWSNQITSVLGRVGLCPFVGSSLNSKAFSPALAVYAEEAIGQARLLARGFVVDERQLGAAEAVEAMAGEKHFLMTPTTLERYQDAYFDSLFPHVGLEKWEEEGCPRADRLVRERARDLMEEAPAPDDHDEVLASGEAFIESLERLLE